MASAASIVESAGFTIAEAGGTAMRLVPRRPLRPGLYDVEIAFASSRLSDVGFDFEYGAGERARLRTIPLAYLGQGRYRSVCDVPEPLQAIVVQTDTLGERLSIAGFRVARLGPLARLRLIGGRAFELLRRDPRALFAAFRRYRAGVVRGDVIVSRRGADTQAGDYETWLATFDDDPARDAPYYRERLAGSATLPSFAIFLALDRFDPEKLDRTVVALQAQFHEAWELHLVAGAELKPQFAELAAGPERDRRIRLLVGQEGDDPATGLNDALTQTHADWVLRLDAGDILRPHALATIGLAIAESTVDLVYSDEDQIDRNGRRHTPRFKPDWSPDLLRSWNYLGRVTAWNTETLRRLGGWREGFGAARDHDLNLRATERLAADRIRHVAKVLVHVEDGGADPARPSDPAAAEASARAVSEHLRRIGRPGQVEPIAGRSILRIRYAIPAPPPLVSIIVPTRDRLPLLRGCLNSILEKTAYASFEVIVVNNASRQPETLRYLATVAVDRRVRVLPYPGPFNFSAINNFAVAQACGSVIALVNNDIEVLAPDWLTEMVGHALRPEIGCVGARLLYPDGTVQHAGIVLGLGGLAGHGHKGLPGGAPGYVGRAIAACNVSAVTAACLVVRRSVYEEVGGLNEELAVAFNDVDFCLKVLRAGYLNLWTPFAELRHHESASRGAEISRDQAQRFGREIELVKRRWGPALRRDPYYSRELTALREDYSLRP